MTVTTAAEILRGRRERALLDYPSVRHMAVVLAARCREQSWARTSVASLERFRAMSGHDDLEVLLTQTRANPAIAEQALASFAAALSGYAESQIAALAMGPKVWFRLNGVAVPWRPLPGQPTPWSLPSRSGAGRVESLVLLSLIGSGLYRAELLRLRVGNVGSLDVDGRLIPDVEAEPLAVQHTPRRGRGGERLTFLTFQARQALLAHIEQRVAAGLPTDLDAPLIAQDDGSTATSSGFARARRRGAALIHACNGVNVELCLATGNFFREWGLPGSRFIGPEELPLEEYV